MDFSEAITAHSQWRIRLQGAIAGTNKELLDPKVVGVDDRCALGQWIYGEAKQYSSMPEYGKLVQEHKAFHATAAKVIQMVAAGQLEEAKASVAKGEFYDASLRTINAIRHLRTKVAP
jgi:methyl-accepting chemotaxis protein